MGLKAIIDGLIKQGQDQEDEAYRILGAHPGPGTDLLIWPQQPLDGKWFATGTTRAGGSFIKKFWFAQPISSHDLNQLKREAIDWKLTFRVEYPVLPLGPFPDVTEGYNGE